MNHGTSYSPLHWGCVLYKDPPKVIEGVSEVDHSLSDDNEEGVKISFDTTFVVLYGLPPGSMASFAVPTTTTQHLELYQSNGKGVCGYYPNYTYYNAVSEYSVPIYNRLFYDQVNYGTMVWVPYRGELHNKHYAHLVIGADTDGIATGLLVNILIADIYGTWVSKEVVHGNGTVTWTYACLKAEYEWRENPEYPGEPEYGWEEIVKFITYVLIVEADIKTFNEGTSSQMTCFVNYRVVDYYTVEEGANLRQTTWYKICIMRTDPLGMYCGHLIETVEEPTGEIEIYEEEEYQYSYPVYDKKDKIYFNGTLIYTSPFSRQGGYSLLRCCLPARMILLAETLFATNETKRMVFIEGKKVWESSNAQDTITVFDCCATHNGQHRYALLGINDLTEEIDDYGGEWFYFDEMNCVNYPPGNPASWETIMQRAWADRMNHQITLTDGTKAYPIDVALDVIETLGGECHWHCWYPLYQTTDGIVFKGLKDKWINHGGLEVGWSIVDVFDPNMVALAKKRVVDRRERTLYHNGVSIGGNKRYDGLFCCGDYALCTYVDDDYLSGWKNEWSPGSGDVWGVERKWNPNPGWGDVMPPSGTDRATWDYYKAVYPGFAVDVFCEGEFVGTFKLSDANSPIHYDHLGIGMVWLLLAAQHLGAYRYDIGAIPWTLEGTPKCHRDKLLIPFDGGITTHYNGELERRIFP
jgi:hypothetical protein